MRAGGACGVLAVLCLAGCIFLPETTPPAAAPDLSAVPPPCGYYVGYSAAKSTELAAGIAALHSSTLPGRQAIESALAELHNMRDACRARPPKE